MWNVCSAGRSIHVDRELNPQNPGESGERISTDREDLEKRFNTLFDT